MAVEINSEDYQKGLDLAEAGKHTEALEYVRRHLRTAPNDAQALNDAGAILYCLGRSGEAIEHFLKAMANAGKNPEVLWNLAEAYLSAGRAAEAMQLFDDMEKMGILNADVINRTAKVFLDAGDKAGAVEMLIRSLDVWSDQEVLRPMIEVVRSKRPGITFLCGLKGDTKFLTDIYEFAGRRFPVKLCEPQDVNEMYEIMQSSDICWFEWCTSLVVEASKLPKVCTNIVRLHRFEAYGHWLGQVQWENIDMLITVGNSFVKEAILNQVPDIESRTRLVTIPNGVNLEKFRFVERERGKNLACVGYLNLRKNPMLLLQCMQKLHYIDPEYRLFFAGDFQDPMLEQYVKFMIQAHGLSDTVFFDGWQDDINAWLADKHYIVSASIGESQGMALLEGMACGLKPVIHNFPGSEQIFPPQFLFNIPEQFCEQVRSQQYEPRSYRRFVEENYPLGKQLGRINEVFARFEAQIDSCRDRDLVDTASNWEFSAAVPEDGRFQTDPIV